MQVITRTLGAIATNLSGTPPSHFIGSSLVQHHHRFTHLIAPPSPSSNSLLFVGRHGSSQGVNTGVFYFRAGDVVSLQPGVEFWVSVLDLQGAVLGLLADNESVSFHLLECGETPARMRPRPEVGETLLGINLSGTIGIDSGGLVMPVRPIGESAHMVLWLGGGEMGTTSADFPLELRLIVSTDSTTALNRIWLFPGRGQCLIRFDLPSYTDQNLGFPWQLEVHNPAGSTGVKTYAIRGHIVSGPAPSEIVRYSINDRDTNIVAPGTGEFATFAFVAPYTTEMLRGQFLNGDSVAAMSVNNRTYIPTLAGGPHLGNEVLLASAPAASWRNADEAIRAQYHKVSVRFDVAPTDNPTNYAAKIKFM